MGLRKNASDQSGAGGGAPFNPFYRPRILSRDDSIDALNAAVRKQYLAVCTPFLGKLSKERQRIKSGSSFINALSKTFSILSPVQGGIASAFIAVDPLEYAPLEPVEVRQHQRRFFHASF